MQTPKSHNVLIMKVMTAKEGTPFPYYNIEKFGTGRRRDGQGLLV